MEAGFLSYCCTLTDRLDIIMGPNQVRNPISGAQLELSHILLGMCSLLIVVYFSCHNINDNVSTPDCMQTTSHNVLVYTYSVLGTARIVLLICNLCC